MLVLFLSVSDMGAISFIPSTICASLLLLLEPSIFYFLYYQIFLTCSAESETGAATRINIWTVLTADLRFSLWLSKFVSEPQRPQWLKKFYTWSLELRVRRSSQILARSFCDPGEQFLPNNLARLLRSTPFFEPRVKLGGRRTELPRATTLPCERPQSNQGNSDDQFKDPSFFDYANPD